MGIKESLKLVFVALCPILIPLVLFIFFFDIAMCFDYRTTIDVIPESWDTTDAQEGYFYRLTKQAFCSLVDIDEQLNISPALSDRWTVSDQGTAYIFHIRGDAFFHNGLPVTADDVVYSLERMRMKGVLSADLKIVKHIKTGENSSEYSKEWSEEDRNKVVVITLFRPFSQLLPLLANPVMGIFPKKNVIADRQQFFKKPISCGPFVISDITNKQIEMRRHPLYYDSAMVKIEKLIFNKIDSPSEALELFNANKLEDMTDLVIDEVKIKQPYNKLVGVTFLTRFIRLNVNKKPFNNSLFRKAFFYSFNRDKFINEVGFDRMISATGFIPKGLPGYQPEQYYNYSPSKAKGLLKEHKDLIKIPIKIISRRENEANALKKVAEDMKRDFGYDLMIVKTDSEQWYNNWYNFDAEAILGGADSIYLDPYFILKYFTSNNKENYSGLRDRNIDALLERATMVRQKDQQAEIYKKIDSLLMDNASLLPLYYGEINTCVFSARVKGLKLPPAGSDFISYKNVSYVGK